MPQCGSTHVGAIVAGLVLMLPLCGLAAAARIECDGVLGNSGEQGATLVRFTRDPARGVGVVCDRSGMLWDRAGKGQLNRYAPDGRLIGQYRLPPQINDGADKLTIVGDRLILLQRDELYALDVTAAAGSAVQPLKVQAGAISFGNANGRIACLGAKQPQFFWLDPVTGSTSDPVELALERLQEIEVGPDAAAYVKANGKLYRIENGKPAADGWPKAAPGERIQFMGNWWYGHSWHGTIRRFDRDLNPVPGVVYGGKSGSFIGHLDENGEVANGRGLAQLRPNLFAVSGIGGTVYLLEWQESRMQFQAVRRIGAVSTCRGIGLDRNGTVWAVSGHWNWADTPDQPLRDQNPPLEPPGIQQAVMLETDAMVASGLRFGKPCLYFGRGDRELANDEIPNAPAAAKAVVAAAAYRQKNRLLLLTATPKGEAFACFIGPDGRYHSPAGPVELKTSTPIVALTSLAMKDTDTLLAAADGAIVEFARDGDNWVENKRWSSWGDEAEATFGKTIWITADAGRLWVSDRDRQRVLLFGTGAGTPAAQFGVTDQADDTLTALRDPSIVAARGDRAVVYDSGNQRLLKLVLRSPQN